MKKLITLLFISSFLVDLLAQRVGIGTNSPHLSSVLDVTSTTSGFLLPRMTSAQRDQIPSPTAGLLVFETTGNTISMYNGTMWVSVGSGASTWTTSGLDIYNSNTGNVGVGVTSGISERLTLKGDFLIQNETATDNGELVFQAQTGASGGGGIISFLDPDTTSGATIRYRPGYNVLGLTNDFADDGSIYLYENGNVGIGTSFIVDAESKLHILHGNTQADYNDNGFLQVGSTSLENIVFGNDEILARYNGSPWPLRLQEEGGLVKIGDLGGTIDTRLYVTDGGESSLTTHGYMVLGSTTSANLVMDPNEIQARLNGAAATLRLQQDGGSLLVQGSALMVASNGFVGLGDLSPSERLTVTGNATFNTTNPIIQLKNEGVDKGFIQLSGDNIRIGTNSTNANGLFVIRTNGTDRVFVSGSGNMGIGTPAISQHRLAVSGSVICEELKVELVADWPDYVFADEYPLRPLHELKAFINTYRHLPDIPKASVIEKEGFEVGDMNKKLLEKIEELTLYIIQQNERIDALSEKLNELQD